MSNQIISQTGNKLTTVAKIVLSGLERESKPAKPEDLGKKLGISLRSVRYGLKLLLDAGLISRHPDLVDLRSYYYTLKGYEMNPFPISLEA